ncbi:MAG: hypothetical protein JWL64_1691 [Frankiales bacterium]|nr:hypothetical protein [Frankiales bacterium]
MHFLLAEDHELMRSSIRGLLAATARVRELVDGPTGFDPVAWRRAAELGMLSMLVPEDLGGGSLTEQPLVDAVVLLEEAGRALAPGPLVSANVVAYALGRWGSAEQQALLPALVAGDQIATWAVAEVDWDGGSVHCAAKRDAHDLVLDGTKSYVEAADVADHLLVTALLDGELVSLLVPGAAAGLSVVQHRSMDLTRRLHTVSLDGVRVPSTAIVPADHEALLRVAAVLTCADAVGGAEVVLEKTVRYTKEREQFGRTIASFQAVKHRCADLLALLEGARAAAHYAALAVDGDQADAELAVSIAKAVVGDAYATITGEGTQLHGGIAFTWEHDLHLYVRRSKADQVLFGAPAYWRRRTWAALEPAGA